MGIQVWFIVLGVGVMTLIVWDGKRRKTKLASHASKAPHQAPALSASLPAKAAVEATPLSTNSASIRTLAAKEPVREGSRIGAATHILGKVIADEPVLIKGQVEGAVIASDHPVTVSATGYVVTYLEGNYVDVDGHVTGVLRANTKATLRSRARIQGDINTPGLECVAGAVLQVDVAHQRFQKRVAKFS